MRPHTSAISGEMPDYFRGKYEWAKPLRLIHPPAKGKKSVIHQVSPDAPASFLVAHITPSTPAAKKAALATCNFPASEIHLLQELKVSQFREFSKFTYEDYSPKRDKSVDLMTLPMKQREDFKREANEGIREKLPFYREYRRAAKEGLFGVKQGMFTCKAAQVTVQRTDVRVLQQLRSRSNSQVRDHSLTPKSPAPHFALAYPISLQNAKAIRAVLTPNSSKRSCKPRAKSVVDTSRADIEQFEGKRKDGQVSLPTTKEVLWANNA